MTARFSQNYLKDTSVNTDSARIRGRIASFYENNIPYKNGNKTGYEKIIAKNIAQELGHQVPTTYNYSISYHVDKFLLQCDLRDFLDSLTIIATTISYPELKHRFIEFIERVFREENAAYTIRDDGSVHPYIDETFQLLRQSTLKSLSDKKYAQVLSVYETSISHLSTNPPNTRLAIKDIFESIEVLSKIIDPTITKLSANEAKRNIKTICESVFQGHQHDKDYLNQMIEGFANWINAHHQYRHGQGIEEKYSPPLEFAELSISTGSSYIRFLVEAHQRNTKTIAKQA